MMSPMTMMILNLPFLVLHADDDVMMIEDEVASAASSSSSYRYVVVTEWDYDMGQSPTVDD
jgi:hypothetical protein